MHKRLYLLAMILQYSLCTGAMDLESSDIPQVDHRGIPAQAYGPLQRPDTQAGGRLEDVEYPVDLDDKIFADKVHDDQWFVIMFEKQGETWETELKAFRAYSKSLTIKTAVVEW